LRGTVSKPEGLLEWAHAWEQAFERCARAYSDNVGPVFAALGEGAVERAGLRGGERVVDIASGPGLITIAAAMRVGPDGLALGIDSSQTMALLAARNTARASGLGRPRFVRGSARALPLGDAFIDAAISSFGLPLSGVGTEFEEAYRVLRPGGRLSLVTFGPAFVDPFFEASRLLRPHRTKTPSAFLAMYREVSERFERDFHKLRAPERLRALAQGAGFAEVTVETANVRQRMWGIMNFIDFVLSFPLNYLEYAEIPQEERDAFHAECQVELKKYMDLEEFIATAELVYLVGVRPASAR
jgi:ubiquinone/menaquinone biosynthesis C-methylase UbiE